MILAYFYIHKLYLLFDSLHILKSPETCLKSSLKTFSAPPGARTLDTLIKSYAICSAAHFFVLCFGSADVIIQMSIESLPSGVRHRLGNILAGGVAKPLQEKPLFVFQRGRGSFFCRILIFINIPWAN